MTNKLNSYNYANYLFENKHNHDITIADEDDETIMQLNKRKNNNDGVDEGMTTANVGGFQTPCAFGKIANGTPKSLPGFNVIKRKERRPDNVDVDNIMDTLSTNESTFIKMAKILHNI